MNRQRALHWEAKSLEWVRMELAPVRDPASANPRVVSGMGLVGWPDQTEFFADIEWRGGRRKNTTPIWTEGFHPPTDDRDGDEQMLATIMLSEVMEETLYAGRLPEPPEFWSDLAWEARVFQSVRARLGMNRSQLTQASPPHTLGFRGWPRETQLFARWGATGAERNLWWPLWDPDFHLPPGRVPGDPEIAATLVFADADSMT